MGERRKRKIEWQVIRMRARGESLVSLGPEGKCPKWMLSRESPGWRTLLALLTMIVLAVRTPDPTETAPERLSPVSR